MTTGLEAGRYCETVGWLSMSGINSSTYFGAKDPIGVPNPTRLAIKLVTSSTTSSGTSTLRTSVSSSITKQASQTVVVKVLTTTLTQNCSSPTSTATWASSTAIRYSRRYLDWNRLTFAYHANGSQNNPFDLDKGVRVTQEITETRNKLNLTSESLYGCAPATYCQSCKPFGAEGNIFGLLTTAMAATVVNEKRKDLPHIIVTNTGHIRFDLVEGPFTYDDSFIVSPFLDAFQFIPDVPWAYAQQLLGILNAGPNQKREVIPEQRVLETRDFNFSPLTGREEACLDPHLGQVSENKKRTTRGTIRRQSTTLVPGYVTTDDFGTDGDDTTHSKIPAYPQPNDIQANVSFPTNGSEPLKVDVVFLDFIAKGYVIPALNSVGGNYSTADLSYYVPSTFTTNSYLPAYAKLAWQKNVPNCPIGGGVGF
jgi:hypothetical protein